MSLNIIGGGQPTYDPTAVQPMREELKMVGVEELLTAQDVDDALGKSGTALVVVNSVCGCAAGNARPGVMMALQNKVIPNQLTTVFAGMEKDAVAQARSHMSEFAPSSPCIALFKDGKAVKVLERHNIEGRGPQEIANELAAAFSEHCDRPGPSIPREELEKIVPFQACGSSIPKFDD